MDNKADEMFIQRYRKGKKLYNIIGFASILLIVILISFTYKGVDYLILIIACFGILLLIMGSIYVSGFFKCPKCNKSLMRYSGKVIQIQNIEKNPYCPKCGQLLFQDHIVNGENKKL